MSWLSRYRLRLYFHNSIWIFPVVSIVLGLVIVPLLSRLERSMGWELKMGPETGRAVMGGYRRVDVFISGPGKRVCKT